jgi:hypothetical protein
MSITRIYPFEVLSAGSNADSAKQRVVSARNGVLEVNARLDARIKGRNNIAGQLNSLTNTLGGIESNISRIKNTVDTIKNEYLRADGRVASRARDFITVGNIAAIIGPSDILGGVMASRLKQGGIDVKQSATSTGATVVDTKTTKSSVWSKVKGGASNLWDGTKSVLNSTEAKSVIRVIGGVAAVGAAIALAPVAPIIAVVALTYGVNDILSGAWGVGSGVEKNFLRSGIESVLGEKVGGAVYTGGKIVSFAGTVAGGTIGAAQKITGATQLKTGLVPEFIGASTGYISTASDIDEYVHGVTGIDSGTISIKKHIDNIDGAWTVISAAT